MFCPILAALFQYYFILKMNSMFLKRILYMSVLRFHFKLRLEVGLGKAANFYGVYKQSVMGHDPEL